MVFLVAGAIVLAIAGYLAFGRDSSKSSSSNTALTGEAGTSSTPPAPGATAATAISGSRIDKASVKDGGGDVTLGNTVQFTTPKNWKIASMNKLDAGATQGLLLAQDAADLERTAPVGGRITLESLDQASAANIQQYLKTSIASVPGATVSPSVENNNGAIDTLGVRLGYAVDGKKYVSEYSIAYLKGKPGKAMLTILEEPQELHDSRNNAPLSAWATLLFSVKFK